MTLLDLSAKQDSSEIPAKSDKDGMASRKTPRARKKKPAPERCDSCETSKISHPDHAKSLHRLRRIQGQLSGIERMIQDRRYCFDILTQFRAVSAALQAMETTVLEKHLEMCVQKAFTSKNARAAEAKIHELLAFLKRH